MNKATSIIEINGNRYDAVSGQLIGAVKQAARQAIKPTQGLSIDGFTRQAARAKAHAKRSVYELQRTPERSKTLMRSVVKKPERARSESKTKIRGLSPDYARASRAKNVPRDAKVQRFGLLPFSRNAGSESEAKSGEIINKPHVKALAHHSAATTALVPSIITNASHHKLERLLDYAMAQADAHKKELDKSIKNRRKLFKHIPRWLVVSLLVLGLTSAALFVVWHKVPQASLKLAATKAHVNASLPTPISGYKVGPITALDNAVRTTIQSTSDSSNKYTVTEQVSNQPAASLVANASGTNQGQQVQTVQDKDKIYVLSQDNNKGTAACTKGANTISVEGEKLNVAQLLEAAKNACKN
ncbi:hypothetical protein BVY00_02230 [bacterium G20]|nr:hypothetical protein BVY00_02230 [bacterium G20]